MALAPLTLTLGAEEAAALQPNHVKKAKDFLSKDYRFAERALKGTTDDTGGKRLIIPIKVQRHSVGTNLATGLESLDRTARPMLTTTQAGLFVYVRPAWWSLRDEIENRGEARQINLLEARTKDMMMGTDQDYEEQSWLTETTDDGVMADLTPFQGDDDATGILEGADAGTQDNVVQGFNKATYANLPGANNQFFDGLDSVSANAWEACNSVNIRCMNLARQAEGTDLRWYVSLTFAELWGKLLQPMEHYVNTNPAADGGKTSSQIEFSIHNHPACVLNNMPNAGTETTADPWSAVLFDHNNLYFRGQSGYVKKILPWVAIPGTPNMMVTLEILAGQNVFEYLGTSGVITNLETW